MMASESSETFSVAIGARDCPVARLRRQLHVSRQRRDPCLEPLPIRQPDGDMSVDRLVEPTATGVRTGVDIRAGAGGTAITLGIAWRKVDLAGGHQREFILRKRVPDLGQQLRAVPLVGAINEPDQFGRPAPSPMGRRTRERQTVDHHKRRAMMMAPPLMRLGENSAAFAS